MKLLRITPLFLLTLFVQCESKTTQSVVEQPEVSPAFMEYIAAYTSGVISNESGIVIDLREPVQGVTAGDKLDGDIFDFSPDIEGEAVWISNKSLEFQPADLLTSGTIFEGEFLLSEVIQDVPSELESFPILFQTMEQYMSVEYEGVSAYDDSDLSWQRIVGYVTTADHALDEQIEEAVSAAQGNQGLNITWEHTGGKNRKFTIDSVRRSESVGQVMIEWDGDPLSSDDSGTETVEISPLGDFELLTTSVTQQPDQYVSLYFSDPVSATQDLSGLIYLKSGVELTYKVSGNRVDLYPRSRLTQSTVINVDQSVRNSMNYQLKDRYERDIRFTNIKPKIELVGSGVIIPESDELNFPFKAVNLNAVNVKIVKIFEDNVSQYLQVNQFDGTREIKRVGRIEYKGEVPLLSDKPIDNGKWNTYSLNLKNLIQTEPGAMYRVIMSFDKSQSLYPCDEEEEEEEEEFTYGEDPEISSYDSPSGYYYDEYYYDDYYYDDYNWREREDPCKKSYYLRGNTIVSRNVVASNFGIIAKGTGKKDLFVAITDLKSTESQSGVDVFVYNYQHQLVGSGVTDAEGKLDLDLEGKPFLLIASRGEERGYLRLDDGSSLSLSMFDVSGDITTDGLKGFIYGERGVWRPGDSLFVSFILEDKMNSLPENHPVVFELYTPENQLHQRKVRTQSVNGFYDFRTSTEQDAPTGNWLAKVKVGGSTYTKTIKIETVKPNRLKLNIDFEDDVLRSNQSNRAKLGVTWLHGAVAKNLKADIEVVLERGSTNFDGFEEYTFDDPAKNFSTEEEMIYDGSLNDQGEADINVNFDVGKEAPGMLNARFKVRAFEKGGDFSVDRFSMPYSAFGSYVGLKIPDGPGWNKALYSNEPNLIPIVTVDEKGNPIDRTGLEVEVYEISWRWWWHRSSNDDLARFISDRSTVKLITDRVNTRDGKAIYELNFNKNTWGRKLIVVTDPVSGHSTGSVFYTSYRGWWNNTSQDSPGGAEMLTFTTDKDQYNVGEEVTINLPGGNKGRALVSIETGSEILETYWTETTSESGNFTFFTTPEMAPNIYVHVSYLQPHANTKNDLPIRMYGVQRLLVEDSETHLKPVIDMPDVLEPEEEVTIRVSEQEGKKMTYTLAMVDEGLLDLTRFNTPDAWRKFYAREALGIKTWDMYKYVLGAYSGELAGLLAVGGDGEIGSGDSGKKANRFKPVVKFFGPIELEAGEENTHTFRMPNYVGSVKTMLVAGNAGAYGKTDKATPVKKPVMVLATLPRVVGPSENVTLPVTVFSMDDEVDNVNVTIEANEMFQIEGSSRKRVNFTEQGDKMAYFDLKVNEAIGIGRVKVIATSGSHRAEYDVELDVRLPNPRITDVIDAAIEPGNSWSSEYVPVGMAGTNNGVVEVSSIPPLNLENRLRYLIRYPHGCIEQTTSSAFPQLFLTNLVDLSDERKDEISRNMNAAIRRIGTFQNYSGGLSYWPGEVNYYSEWGTNYAGHFMLEAQKKGYSLPPGFIKKWTKFQRDRANSWVPNQYSSRRNSSDQLIQAYRLYTLALAGKPAVGAMNRMRESKTLTTAAKWRLASAYHLAGRERAARDIINNLETDVREYSEMSYSYGSSTRDRAMILEALVQMDDLTKAKDVFDDLIDKIGSRNWYSTQTTAYSLLAIAKFVGDPTGSSDLNYTLKINNNSNISVESEVPVSQTDLGIRGAEKGNLIITNGGDRTIFVKVQLDGIPVTGEEINKSNNLTMTVRYKDLDGNELDVGALYQGTDFVAEVTVKHPGFRSEYKEMALTQIFPSGWEIRNLRMDETSSSLTKSTPRYQDIRDDRVLTYFDLEVEKSKTFTVLLNAAYLGRYYLPTTYAEAMYDNEINASSAGRWVEVQAEGVQ